MNDKISYVKSLNEYMLSKYIKKGDLILIPFFFGNLVKVDFLGNGFICCGRLSVPYCFVREVYRKRFFFSKPRLVWSFDKGFVD